MTVHTPIRVLVIDDDPAVLAIAKLSLERIGGFEVATADGGKAALQILQNPENQAFSLVLLDLMMPGMDGTETLAKMRSLPRCDQLPVVFSSAAVERAPTSSDAFVLGGISKPFRPTELPALVRGFLNKASQQ